MMMKMNHEVIIRLKNQDTLEIPFETEKIILYTLYPALTITCPFGARSSFVKFLCYFRARVEVEGR